MPASAWKTSPDWYPTDAAAVSRLLASLVSIQSRILRQFPRNSRQALVSQDQQAALMLKAVGKVRTAVVALIPQLPARAFTGRAVGLLAFGITRSWGVGKKAQSKSVRQAVTQLADTAHAHLTAVADTAPGAPALASIPAIQTSTISVSARDCALLASSLMKAGVSGHPVWPVLVRRVRALASQSAAALQLDDAAYLAEALAWELRMAKPSSAASSEALATEHNLLMPVLRQTLMRCVRGGVTGASAYKVAVLLSAFTVLSAPASQAAVASASVPTTASTAAQAESKNTGRVAVSSSASASASAPAPGSPLDVEAAVSDEQMWKVSADAVLRVPIDTMSTQAVCALMAAFSRSKVFDAAVLQHLALAALSRADKGEASISHMASVLSSLANCNMVWVDAALTEDIFIGMSPALTALSPASFSVQQAAVIASAFAKAKIFDELLFAHLSRAVQWRGRDGSEFTVQVVGVLLFAFSRIQVDDPKLLDFLAQIIFEIPAADFTPQALSVVISVYAGAHRRRSFTSLQTSRVDPADLPPATGILEHLAAVASQLPPQSLEARHVRAIVQAYHRAGVRGQGLFEVMSRSWEARWGSGFKTEREMITFFSSLDDEDSKTSDSDKDQGDGDQGAGVTRALRRWITGT